MRALLIEVSEDMRDKKLRAQQHKEFLELVHTHGDIEVVDTYTQRIQPIYKTYM